MLWLWGAVLAGVTAPIATARLGLVSGLAFTAVAVAAVVLAVNTLRGKRWALVLDLVGCGGQIFGVVGTVWELAHPIDTAKSRDLRALGVDPTLAVTVNLVYSAVAWLLFVWMAIRWIRIWRSSHRLGSDTVAE